MDVSDIHYARVGASRIAYQTFGAGPRAVYIPPIVSHIELKWEHELQRRVLEHLGSYLRVVHFDKRGIGLSDRLDDEPTLEERIDDIGAVMDAVGWDRAHLFGASEGADMALLFASRHPDRVDRVVAIGGCAPSSDSEVVATLSDGPVASDDERLLTWIGVVETWGEDATTYVGLLAPSRVDDPAFVRWMNRLNRYAASPGDFMKQLLNVAAIEGDGDPAAVTAPTLLIHLRDDRVRPVGHGRRLAQLVPNSTYLELEGTDHLFYSESDWREAIDHVVEFLTGTRPALQTQRHFAVVTFTDIVGSTSGAAAAGDASWRQTIEEHDRICHRTALRHEGRIVKSTGDGVLALFTSPSRAIEAVTDIRRQVADLGLAIRAGLHAGEVEERADGDVSGVAVNLAARVEQAAPDGTIFVSPTVQQMVMGGAITLEDAGEHTLKGFDGTWRLYEVATD